MKHTEENMDLRKLENHQDIYENEDIKALFGLTMFGPTDGKIKKCCTVYVF